MRSILPTTTPLWLGGVGALAVALLPGQFIERLLRDGAAAALPLGAQARMVLTGGAGLVVAVAAWAVLTLLGDIGGCLRAAPSPRVRRADAHPDAPPRRPMTAADLGTPLMEVVAHPSPPVAVETGDDLRRVAHRAAPLAPGERIETFPLMIPPPSQQGPILPIRREPEAALPVATLLRRLEKAAEHRVAPLESLVR